MNVKELIEKLSKYPDDTIVVTEGYENGFNDILEVKTIKLSERNNKEWWDGKYINEDFSDSEYIYLYSRKIED